MQTADYTEQWVCVEAQSKYFLFCAQSSTFRVFFWLLAPSEKDKSAVNTVIS